ncbi:rhodanese-like domain-containing protein [Chitinispirillales bacterium ANBcel5]|uniref:rhodanese-like domain-containing protein n=1 Tax=Cellulosispirillum alkaliphilum TaxID=3039283 RepID=UPI002A50E29D|nr:rhodanese-like domain-containing protein [Chitinispirillales bacterium ANBcel5]
MDTLSTPQVSALLGRADVELIDVRSVDAYNGWRLQHEARGGHIRGARSLPCKWTRYIDWPDILREKRIDPQSYLILYGNSDDQVGMVANRLKRAGYSNLALYNSFISQWCQDPSKPMQKLSRYRDLIPARYLYSVLNKINDGNTILCHVHYQNPDSYTSGHIPGAIDLDTNKLEDPQTWNRRSPEELKKALEECGITTDTTVILYGKFSSPHNNQPFPGSNAGHLGAMRAGVILRYAGVKEVKILNGGLQAWIDESYALSTEWVKKKPVTEFRAPIPLHPEYFTNIDKAKGILKDPLCNLVCVRSRKEYKGEVSGYNYINKKGRIPGAVFAEGGSDAYHMENYRNVDHTTKEYHQIETMWNNVGITPDKHNSFYCGTGWRASEAFMNAWFMGYHNISVFDGGWFEWSNDPTNPVITK